MGLELSIIPASWLGLEHLEKKNLTVQHYRGLPLYETPPYMKHHFSAFWGTVGLIHALDVISLFGKLDKYLDDLPLK